MLNKTYKAIEVGKLLGLENNMTKVYEMLKEISNNSTEVYKDTSKWYFNDEWIVSHMDLITYILPLRNPIFIETYQQKLDGCTSDSYKFEMSKERFESHRKLISEKTEYYEKFNNYIRRILSGQSSYEKETTELYKKLNKEAIFKACQSSYDNNLKNE